MLPFVFRRTVLFVAVMAVLGALGAGASANFDDPTLKGPSRPMTFPVIGKVSYSDTYGAPRTGHTHEGQDLMGAKMQLLVAANAGTITRLTIPEASYGYSLVITDDEGWSYHYLHINNDTPGTDDGLAPLADVFAPGLKLGSRVNAGQFVAYMGDSGNAESTAPHLHFELHDPTGAPVNPYAALLAATKLTTPSAGAPDVPVIPRIYGKDRILTAVAASKSAWYTSGNVVVASGGAYAEALPASVLAAKRAAPLLLTGDAELPQAVVDEIGRLKATTVTVVGSVPELVDASLQAKGLAVNRIAGADPVETAALIAKSVGASYGNAVVVNADRFADGISAAGLAAGRNWPILLVNDTGVPTATADALKSLRVTRTWVVGGTDVVSDAVTASLPGVSRLAGADRYATSAAVAAKVVSLGTRSLTKMYLATGSAYPDALTAGALAARTRGIVLLVDGTGAAADTASQAFLADHSADVALKAVLGGFAAVGIDATRTIATLFGLQ